MRLAIIPARGGSKRIQKKNIKSFFGKPIISYSIEVARSCGLFDEVMVSTDDEEISKIAMEYGAEIPFKRSVINANDLATTTDVLLEVIYKYESLDKFFDTACCIYPTAPFISSEILKEGYEKMVNDHRSSIIPVIPFDYPIWRGFTNYKDGSIKMIWPENLKVRSQDLKPVYHDAGQWYWFSVHDMKKNKSLFTENTGSIELQPLEVQDIDDMIDWELAELKYKLLHKL